MISFADILIDQNVLSEDNTYVDFKYRNFLDNVVEGEITGVSGLVMFNPCELDASYVNITLPMVGMKFQKIDDKALLQELIGEKGNMLDSITINFSNFIDLGERYVAKGEVLVGEENREVLLFVYYKLYEDTRVLTAELKLAKPVYSDRDKGLNFENTFQLNIVLNLDA